MCQNTCIQWKWLYIIFFKTGNKKIWKIHEFPQFLTCFKTLGTSQELHEDVWLARRTCLLYVWCKSQKYQKRQMGKNWLKALEKTQGNRFRFFTFLQAGLSVSSQVSPLDCHKYGGARYSLYHNARNKRPWAVS